MKLIFSLIAVIAVVVVCFLNAAAGEEGREGREVFPSRRAFVEITQGALQGKISKSRKGASFYEFLDIPYGNVVERFGVAEPSGSWEGLRDATKYGPSCVQVESGTKVVFGVEDCLSINVFTPNIPLPNVNSTLEKLPVMFSIHGGGFIAGNVQSLRPDYFMDHKVILVTVQYRLGPFGFLNAGVPGAAGNQGLKDLVLALKWVQGNIQRFGGDPEKVTLNGGVAGAYAVSYLTLSPLATGLFSRAISESGSALCPWTKQTKRGLALENAKKLANALDCPSSNKAFLVKCLQRIDAGKLLEQTISDDVLLFEDSNYNNPWFGPSLEEPGVSSDEPFLSKEPLETLQEGSFNKVPYILGANSHDGNYIVDAMLLTNATALQRLNKEFGRVLPNTLLYAEFTPDPCKVTGKIRKFYLQGKEENITKFDRVALSSMFADRGTLQCVRDTAILYSRFAPVYLYNMSRAGEHSVLENVPGIEVIEPPTHSDEMQYLFPSRFQIGTNDSSSDFAFSERMLELWTSFASLGKPNSTDWLPFNGNESPYRWFELRDSPAIQLEDEGLTSRMEFWASLELDGSLGKSTLEKLTSTPAAPAMIEDVTTSTPATLPAYLSSSPATTTTTTTYIPPAESTFSSESKTPNSTTKDPSTVPAAVTDFSSSPTQSPAESTSSSESKTPSTTSTTPAVTHDDSSSFSQSPVVDEVLTSSEVSLLSPAVSSFTFSSGGSSRQFPPMDIITVQVNPPPPAGEKELTEAGMSSSLRSFDSSSSSSPYLPPGTLNISSTFNFTATFNFLLSPFANNGSSASSSGGTQVVRLR